jgi:hypothetical protein
MHVLLIALDMDDSDKMMYILYATRKHNQVNNYYDLNVSSQNSYAEILRSQKIDRS